MKTVVSILAASLTAGYMFAQAPAAPAEAAPTAIPVAPAVPVEPATPAEPSPTAAPAAEASPTPEIAPSPTPTPTPTPTTRELVNSLSQADVQDTLRLLKSNYIAPQALSEQEVYRATLEGFLDRLGPGAQLLPKPADQEQVESPFRAEILDDRIGYLRLGSLSQDNVGEMDAALDSFAAKKLNSVILDLRSTPASSDFELAAEVVKRFSPKGKMLFAVKKPSVKQERILTSNQDPKFQGLLVVVVSDQTAGAAEVIAAALKTQARALIVGEKTMGQAVEYADLPLHGDKILRVAVAEVNLPDQESIYPDGLKPDVTVNVPDEEMQAVLEKGLKDGVSELVFESERPRMNEASLVAGTNPEFEAMQESLRNEGIQRRSRLRDVMLQRAVDLLTTLAIYEKPPRS